MSQATCRYMVNHVVLPLRLPQSAEDDDVVRAGDSHLTTFLIAQVENHRMSHIIFSSTLSKAWTVIETMLRRFGDLTSPFTLTAEDIVDNLRYLQKSGE